MLPLPPLPLEARVGLACGAAAVLLGLGLWVRHYERTEGAKECRAEVTAATLKATQDAQAELLRRIQTQAEVSNEADRLANRARADAAAGTAVDRRLLDAASRGACRTPDPGAAGAGPTAAVSRWVPAELLEKSLAESRDLAARADAAFIAGQACERSYNALTRR